MHHGELCPVRFLQYSELYDAGEEESSSDVRHMFFGHLTKSYRAFLSGDDDMYAALQDELASQYGTDTCVHPSIARCEDLHCGDCGVS